MDRTKLTGSVAYSIAGSHTCLLLPVEPSEGHSLLEKNLQAGRALAFDSSVCYKNKICAFYYSVHKELLVSQVQLCIQSNGQQLQKLL
jgi:hypothetical protein